MMIQNSPPVIVRRGFGLKAEVRPSLIIDYHSELVNRIRSDAGTLKVGRLTLQLAEKFGFCYGVDNALNLVYETRRKFPGRRIFLASEILHNEDINERLSRMGIFTLKPSLSLTDKFACINRDDIVLIPAFGATNEEYQLLRDKECLVVDTTCGSVVAVWKRVERYARDGFTAIIHGKFAHEETRATSSQALKYPAGKYLVVLDHHQAQYVCNYIVGGGDKKEFLRRFSGACSPGFNPDTDLCRIGLANQTTMLSSESLKIAEMFRGAVAARYGAEALAGRFRHFDTICNATQERQDAVLELLRQGVDLMLVVGGYSSCNTAHLAELSSLYKPTYYIDRASCVLSSVCMRHKSLAKQTEIITEGWLPSGQITIGLTAGASTPERIVGEVIDRVVSFCNATSEKAGQVSAINY